MSGTLGFINSLQSGGDKTSASAVNTVAAKPSAAVDSDGLPIFGVWASEKYNSPASTDVAAGSDEDKRSVRLGTLGWNYQSSVELDS